MTRTTRFVALVAVLACGAAGTASAQIYTWRDANGNLVLSDTPPAESAAQLHSYAVANSTAPVRATRPASDRYQNNYDDVIVEHARAQGIRPDLVRAVIQVESGYDPHALSPKGAMGLMQLMPYTASALGVTRPYDPEQNIRGGVKYLRQLLDRYGDNEELALAAYNAGPGAVGRYGNRVPPYRETREYVRKVRTRTNVSATSAPRRILYRITEIVDGRSVSRWTDRRPADGDYQVWDATR